jgi:hypothetical protein
MDINLLELKRYAIDNRVEVKFGDSDNQFAINDKGLAKVLSEDKTVRVESILSAATSFEVAGKGKTQHMSRDEMARAINNSLKGRGVAAVEHEDE